MPQLITRMPKEMLLELRDPEKGLFPINHIFEPEYHQEDYVSVCNRISSMKGSYKLGNIPSLTGIPHRGLQPLYSDDDNDPSTIEFEGMVKLDGTRLGGDTKNVCALTSTCIRFGYIDLSLARSISRKFFLEKNKKAGVKRNDVLINSTGDGTIGRVAVYNYNFPAIVDGHITIIRLHDQDLAWYLAAYLLSDDGQKQIFRYINGSSGQVEIYPQDIERIWVKPASREKMKSISQYLRSACEKHDEFYQDLLSALNKI